MKYILNFYRLINFLVSFLLLSGCYLANRNFSKDDVSNQASTGTGVTTPDLFTAGRIAAQSRSVLNLNINDSYDDRVQDVTVVNTTNNQTLVDNLGVSLGVNSAENESFDVVSGGTQVVVKIYPSVDGAKGKLNFGTNTLQLITHSNQGAMNESIDVTVQDFKYFGPVYSGILTTTTTQKPIDGGVNAYGSGVVSNGSSFLITNPAHIYVH